MSLAQIKPLELLVVEDNPGDVLLLKEYLTLSHIPVRNIWEAGSVKEVSDVLMNRTVDLAFLDLSLPDSEGIYSFISLNSRLPHTPIIVLTGLADLNVALEALSLGAQDYVMKNDFNEKLLYKSIQYSIERKKMMEKLRESNERYEIVGRATNDFIWDWDLENNSLYNNPEGRKNMFGFEDKDALNSMDKWFSHIHPNDLANVKAMLESVRRPGSGNTFAVEYRFRKSDGTYTHVFDRGYVIRDKDGNAIRMIGAAQDITERKQSEREMQQLNEQLRSLTAYLQNIREEEQTRIAREIHDELGQQITGLKMDVAWLKRKLTANVEPMAVQGKLNTMTSLLDETVQTIRKISSELRPSILDDIGLVAALEWQSNEFEKRFHIPVRFRASSRDLQVPAAVATGLFRMYQESLTNIARHAEASVVTGTLEAEDNKLIMTVSDDGKGFVIDPAKKPTLGMLGMKERALMIGAMLNISSVPGKGTVVTVSLPFDQT
jgi:two-component system, NarL family, sensor histidine kinase UhpB